MGRILIAYKSPLGFYTDLIATKHRHLDDLIIDLKRMVLMADAYNKAKFADYTIYALGEFDDEKGKLSIYDTEEFILQFPSAIPVKEKTSEVVDNGCVCSKV